MSHSREFYFVVLGFAFMEIRWSISVREPDDYVSLCSTMVDVITPIPPALLTWSNESEKSLYDDMKERSALAGRIGLFKHWIAYAEDRVEEGANPEEISEARKNPDFGFSATQYLLLLSRVVEKMAENKEDLAVLYAFSDAFHNLPGTLCHEWTDEREARVYENLMARSTDRGIRDEVEQWMYEIVGESAKTRAAGLPF